MCMERDVRTRRVLSFCVFERMLISFMLKKEVQIHEKSRSGSDGCR